MDHGVYVFSHYCQLNLVISLILKVNTLVLSTVVDAISIWNSITRFRKPSWKRYYL